MCVLRKTCAGDRKLGRKSLIFMPRRPKPVTVTVKDKGMQSQEKKTKDKATQTSIIELQPGEDVNFVRWTGVVRTTRPLLEADRIRIYSLMGNLRRAVADVLGGEKLDAAIATSDLEEERRVAACVYLPGDSSALPIIDVDGAFASVGRCPDEQGQYLQCQNADMKRAMLATLTVDTSAHMEDAGVDTSKFVTVRSLLEALSVINSNSGSDGQSGEEHEEIDGSISIVHGSSREVSSAVRDEAEDSEGVDNSESEVDTSFTSALSGDAEYSEVSGEDASESSKKTETFNPLEGSKNNANE